MFISTAWNIIYFTKSVFMIWYIFDSLFLGKKQILK